jgi:F0F1-type ATP synthase assembly protein I
MSERHGNVTGTPVNRLEKAGARVRQRALSGTEASTVGFVLVAYISAGAGTGYLLDTFFKTSWIVALGLFTGALIGFLEMFRMAQKITRQSIREDHEMVAKKLVPPYVAVTTDDDQKRISVTEVGSPSVELVSKAPRRFLVPPPPAASYELKRSVKDEHSRDES